MPIATATRWLLAITLIFATALPAGACSDPSRGLGVARIVEVDATAGPVFGFITKQQREKSFLGPKEVVLTFDDGPMPSITRTILETLDQFCTKATFFSVGRMAAAYPDSVREILRRGHTLGTHTWSHPMSLPRIGESRARDQIESGFAAVATAAGQPIAPFFRFPGLNDSAALIKYLADRNIATFTVDVVSNDSYIADPQRLIAQTLQRVEAENGGIMLFHDIKPQTARALPTILSELRRRGFKVVHLTSKHPFVPEPQYVSAISLHIVERKSGPDRKVLLPITGVPPAPSPEPSPATIAAAPLAPIPSDPVAKTDPSASAGTPGTETKPERRATKRAKPAPQPAISSQPPAPLPPVPQPLPAGSPPPQPAPQIEIVAGNYSKSGAPLPTAINVAPPKRQQPTWQENLVHRTIEAGN